MKRFLLCIAILGMAMFTFATKPAQETTGSTFKDAVATVHQDVKDITTTLYGDGKDAVSSLYPDVKQAIIAIGSAIGCAAEHVYIVLVKKFVVDGIVQLLPFILGLILIIIAWVKTGKYFKTHERINWHILYPLCLLIAGIISLACVDYNTMVMGLVNPEYGALNYILEYSKAMIK